MTDGCCNTCLLDGPEHLKEYECITALQDQISELEKDSRRLRALIAKLKAARPKIMRRLRSKRRAN